MFILSRHWYTKYHLSVPCTRQLQEEREKEKKEFTVLAEFSSVVADTQQYIVDEEHTQGQSQVYMHWLFISNLVAIWRFFFFENGVHFTTPTFSKL